MEIVSIERPGWPSPGLSRVQRRAPFVDLNNCPSLVPIKRRSGSSGEATSDLTSPPHGPVISHRRTSPLLLIEDNTFRGPSARNVKPDFGTMRTPSAARSTNLEALIRLLLLLVLLAAPYRGTCS